MHKIRLKTLRFSNILSYGGNVNEVIFGDGLTWIKGPNGSGKSSIIEALNFALFSTSFRNMKKGELRNSANKGKMKVELSFEREDSRGNHSYIITREMGKGSPKTTIEIDGVEQLKEAGFSQKLFEEEVLGFNQNIFENVISLNTIETTPFIDMDPGKKRKLIESMLTLQIDKFKDVNKKALKEAQTKMESAKSDAVKYEKDVLELEEMATQLKSEQADDIEELEEKICEYKNLITSHKDAIEVRQNEYNGIMASTQEIQKKVDGCPDYDDMIEKRRGVISLLMHINTLTPKRKEKYNESRTAKVHYMDCKQKRLPEVGIDDIKVKRLELEELQKLKAGYEGTLKLTDENRLEIEKKGKDLKAGVECPTCGKPSTEDDIEALKEEYRLQWKSAKDAIAIHQNAIDSCDKKIKVLKPEIDDLENALEAYNESERNYLDAEKESKRIQGEYLEINDEYIDAMNALGDTGFGKETIDGLNAEIDGIKETKKVRDGWDVEIKDLLRDSKIIEHTITQYESKIKEIDAFISETHDKIQKKQIQSDDDSISLLEKKIKGTRNDFERAKTRVTKYSDEISITKYIESMYDDDGIKKIVLGIFVPNLNKAIAHNLNLFSLPFMIEFDDAMDFRFESRFGLAPSYNALSQGQKRKLNFAIAVAFRDFVTSIADFKINILFLDEVLDISTDEESLEHMIQLLKTKVPEIGGTYLMTHRGEQFSEYFEYCIQVQNNGRYSSLEMKELPKSSNY